MKTRLSLRLSNREKAAEENIRNVPFLALKNYDSLVMIAKKLDAQSFVKLGKTSKVMHQKLKLLRGVRIPFNMGEIHWYGAGNLYPFSLMKDEAFRWNLSIASKIKDKNPLFEPFVTRIAIYPDLTTEVIEKLNGILNRMKAKKLNALFITTVHQEAWEDLKDFIAKFKVGFVHIYYSEMSAEQQNSPVFLELPYLDHNGIWSYDYLMKTTRPKFAMGHITSETFNEILKRWLKQKFEAWEMLSNEFDCIDKCKEKYTLVTVRQKSEIPETRPLLCDMGEKNCISTLAILLEDGRVIFIKSVKLLYEINICIQEAEMEKYPPVFKKILGIAPIQRKRKHS